MFRLARTLGEMIYGWRTSVGVNYSPLDSFVGSLTGRSHVGFEIEPSEASEDPAGDAF